MRHYREMPTDAKRKLLAKVVVKRANEKIISGFTVLANKEGSESDEIHDLMQRSSDKDIPRHALIKARSPDHYQYDEAVGVSHKCCACGRRDGHPACGNLAVDFDLRNRGRLTSGGVDAQDGGAESHIRHKHVRRAGNHLRAEEHGSSIGRAARVSPGEGHDCCSIRSLHLLNGEGKQEACLVGGWVTLNRGEQQGLVGREEGLRHGVCGPEGWRGLVKFERPQLVHGTRSVL